MQIDFLYFEDCPSHEQALERLRKVLNEEDVEAGISVTEVTTEEAGARPGVRRLPNHPHRGSGHRPAAGAAKLRPLLPHLPPGRRTHLPPTPRRP